MDTMVLAISEDMAFAVFSLSAIGCLGLSFLIVCLIHPIGNKMLMLGILVVLTAFVFAATEPSAGTWLPIIMIAIGGMLVLTGIVCSVISHLSPPKLFMPSSDVEE